MTLYYSEYGDKHPRTKKLSQKVLHEVENIDSMFRRKGVGSLSFLDIGAASGELVEAFLKKGWEASGIELSSSFVEFSKKERGLTLISKPVEDVDFPEASFDYIHFWHVIEHLRDPGLVLKNIFKWLKPGGVLNLGTPNPMPPLVRFNLLIRRRFDLGVDHTYGFRPPVLRWYLKKIGFEIISHRVYVSKRRQGLKGKLSKFLYKTMQQIKVRKP